MAYEYTLELPFLAGILVLTSLFVTWYRGVDPLLDAIPTIGFSDPILSYLSALRFRFVDDAPILKEAYERSKPGLFKYAEFTRWVVMPSGPELIEDVRKATDEFLSVDEPREEFTQSKYTFGFLNPDDFYHRNVVRSKLTRNMSPVFDQVHDELLGAVKEYIPALGKEWVNVSILPTMQRLICRISNRVLVGAPLCRNSDYHALASKATVDILKSAHVIAMVPKPLKPIVARIVSKVPSYIRQMKNILGPIIEERLAKMEAFGENYDDARFVSRFEVDVMFTHAAGAQNDMLMWLMSEAKGVERSLEGLTRRMLLLNFASIHTTSNTVTQALYRLLDNPDYIEPLRREVEAVVAEDGWTKAGLDKMRNIDSFIRESQRLDVLAITGISRLTLRPFRFSNGVTIPAGTFVSFPLRAIHTDGEIYPNPQEFDGFRFSKLRDREGDTVVGKHRMVSSSAEYLGFGLGRHACPGRYFAAIEIKALLAHIVVTYDIKFEEGKGVPCERQLGRFRLPANANVLFRKRQT